MKSDKWEQRKSQHNDNDEWKEERKKIILRCVSMADFSLVYTCLFTFYVFIMLKTVTPFFLRKQPQRNIKYIISFLFWNSCVSFSFWFLWSLIWCFWPKCWMQLNGIFFFLVQLVRLDGRCAREMGLQFLWQILFLWNFWKENSHCFFLFFFH